MTAASLTACGSGGKGAESAPAAAEGTGNTTAASTEAESSTTGSEESDADGYVGSGGTYTMYLRSTFVDWINDLEWYKEAEKRTGVTLWNIKKAPVWKTMFIRKWIRWYRAIP